MDGKEVRIAGWVHEVRDIGKIIFMVVRDHTGLIQVTAKQGTASAEVLAAMKLVKESVVTVRGTVKTNAQSKKGIEIVPIEIKDINPISSPIPFEVTGGTFVNVVPGKAVINGEVRAFTYKKMQKKLDQIESVVSVVCKSTGCKHKFVKKTKEGAPPLMVHRDKDILLLAKAAAEDANLQFSLRSLRGTTEANNINAHGISLLGVSRGGDAPHAKNEAVEIIEFQKLTKLIVALVKNTAHYA